MPHLAPHRLFLLSLFALLLAAIPSEAATDTDVSSDIREGLLRSTGRIRYERTEYGSTITGHGTAFCVDLSQYGFAGRRYLLTAAHNVLDNRKRPFSTLKVEMQEGTRTYWSRCRAVVWDENLDLCIVEAEDEMPGILRMADTELPVGRRLILAGSPRGVPIQLHDGTLNRKFEGGSVRFSATVSFDHGNSGGPAVDAVSGRVVGVAVAGVPKDGDLDRNIGLFVPIVGITSFLDANRRAAPEPEPVIEPPAAAISVARSIEPEVASAVAKPSAASTVEFREPVADIKGPMTDSSAAEKVSVAVSAPVSAVAAPSPAPVAPVEVQGPAPERAVSPESGLVVASEMTQPEPGTVYVVQKGDNLTKIARQCNVSVDELAKVNGLKDPNRLLAGAKLVIPMN